MPRWVSYDTNSNAVDFYIYYAPPVSQAAELSTTMPRQTDNDGRPLGGLEFPLSRLLSLLSEAQSQAVVTKAPAKPPRTPEYRPDETVFALHCSHGSLPTLGFSVSAARRRLGCDTLVEEPEERHFCPACEGYYCQAHAQRAAHDCWAVLRAE